MEISVRKLTDVSLLRRANSFTTHKESKMTLATAYRHMHSPIRTQIFWIELCDIPLFCASQLVRSKIGVEWYQRTKRTDRGGEDFVKICGDLADWIEQTKDDISEIMTESQCSDTLLSLSTWKEDISGFPKRFDRFAPTDIACIVNAEELMNMSHKRLCSKASEETMKIFQEIKKKVSECDPDLAKHLVPTCVFRGGLCPEPQCCYFYKSTVGSAMLNEYERLMEYK